MADRAYPLLTDEEFNCLDASCTGHPETCNEERLVLIRAVARLHDELESLLKRLNDRK
jgi:hypothetical protein